MFAFGLYTLKSQIKYLVDEKGFSELDPSLSKINGIISAYTAEKAKRLSTQ
jgi:translation elongation factor EF-1beta